MLMLRVSRPGNPIVRVRLILHIAEMIYELGFTLIFEDTLRNLNASVNTVESIVFLEFNDISSLKFLFFGLNHDFCR
jgi:hypothetical protein